MILAILMFVVVFFVVFTLLRRRTSYGLLFSLAASLVATVFVLAVLGRLLNN